MKKTYDIIQQLTHYPFMTFCKDGCSRANIIIGLSNDFDEDYEWQEYELSEDETKSFYEALEVCQKTYGFTMDDVSKCNAYINENDNNATILLVWVD